MVLGEVADDTPLFHFDDTDGRGRVPALDVGVFTRHDAEGNLTLFKHREPFFCRDDLAFGGKNARDRDEVVCELAGCKQCSVESLETILVGTDSSSKESKAWNETHDGLPGSSYGRSV